MNNYLLSIDPAIKNTGFVLWENKNCNSCLYCANMKNCWDKDWQPIWVGSYNFNKFNENWSWDNFKSQLHYKITSYSDYKFTDLDLIIEGGFNNPKMARGNAKLERLRGFIGGQFNKLINDEDLIYPAQWRKIILDWMPQDFKDIIMETLGIWITDIKDKKERKNWWFDVAVLLISYMNWAIMVNNHDEAEALLIGWAKINEKNT